MCPLLMSLNQENIETIVCVIGSMRQMLDQVLGHLMLIQITDLSIKDKQTLFDITKYFKQIKEVL